MIRYINPPAPDAPVVSENNPGLISPEEKVKLSTIPAQQTISLSNFPNGGLIGTADQTVDITNSILIEQTTSNQSLLLPIPTDSSNIKTIFITNKGSVLFNLYTTFLVPNSTGFCLWNGINWNILISNSSISTTDYNIIYTSGDLVIGDWNTLVIVNTNNIINITIPISDIFTQGNKILITRTGSNSGSINIYSSQSI